ncbi:Dystrophin [Chelonia mydas]|uniref:Dystrophin n=1 Tax=Chelonia mydas TaxID=8469 RepID=M7BAS9_CHEMY|nr:Dystrophin [Chelonia mydas]
MKNKIIEVPIGHLIKNASLIWLANATCLGGYSGPGIVVVFGPMLCVTYMEAGVGNRSKLHNFSYVNNIAEVCVLRSTHHGVFTAVSQLLLLPRRLRLRLSHRFSTGVNGRALGGRYIVSRLDAINRPPLDQSLPTNSQFSKELRQWQIHVDVANDMALKLLRDYSTDDTRKVELMTDNINTSWATINKRYNAISRTNTVVKLH